ncbi:MAG: DedA family protein [Actinobacteria bacterium]|nr:DedA family protein [Actinomycetota bacterium]
MPREREDLVSIGLFFGGGTIDHWLSSYGYWVVFLLVMAESLGIPLPGETALISAALYAGTTHKLQIWWVILVATAGAIIGDNIGFAIGRVGGARLLLRYGSKVGLSEARLRVAIWFFRRYGGRVVFFGRFVSILRTYAAFLAGANGMEWKRFLFFNAAGGVVWATVYGVAYYEAGSSLKGVSTKVDIVIGVAAALLLVAGLWYLKRKEKQLEERAAKEVTGPLEEELHVGR